MKRMYRLLWFGLLISLSLLIKPALAHTEVPVGKYTLEIGWVNEPVLLGETNGIFLSIVNGATGKPVEGANTVTVSVMTGGKTRALKLHPLGEDAPGQYAADFIPTVRGIYTVKLQGTIEDQAVDITQEIEEVETAEDYQFPVVLPALPEINQRLATLQTENQTLQATVALTRWLAIGGVVLGFAGVIVGLSRWRKG